MEDFPFGLIIFGVIVAISIFNQKKQADKRRRAQQEAQARTGKVPAPKPAADAGQSLRDVLKQIATEFTEPDAEAQAQAEAVEAQFRQSVEHLDRDAVAPRIRVRQQSGEGRCKQVSVESNPAFVPERLGFSLGQ